MKWIIFLLLMAGCAGVVPVRKPDPAAASAMSLGEAKELIQRTNRWIMSDGRPDQGGLVYEFTPDRIVDHIYNADGTTRLYMGCLYDAYDPYVPPETQVVTFGRRNGTTITIVGSGPRGSSCDLGVWTAPEQADRVAAAFLRWKQATAAERQAWQAQEEKDFAAVAEKYRSTEPRPVISEEVRRFEVIGKAFAKDGRYSDAANAYEDGLKLAPWWPTGHFDAALMLAEIRYYDEAIDHMKKYLALAPEAPDAKKARDQLYEWEAKSR